MKTEKEKQAIQAFRLWTSKSNPKWAEDFLKEFAVCQVPYHFLNRHKRLALVGHGQFRHCEFADGICTYRKHSRITQNGETLKNENNVFLPYVHEDNSYFAYSENGYNKTKKVNVQSGTADIYEITTDGLRLIGKSEIKNSRLQVNVQPEQALLIRIEN